MPFKTSPAPVTGKRKRDHAPAQPSARSADTIHITVGSYERVLHGFTATVPAQLLRNKATKTQAQKSPAEQKVQAPAQDQAESNDSDENRVTFTDAFLLAPHSSSIRAVAVSPPLHGKRYLASGGADERINVYQIGSVAPALPSSDKSTNKRRRIVEIEAQRRAALAGRELGTLTPHTAIITGLAFCGHAKLLSTSLDNSICVTRTRDWTPLTTLKAPHPQSAHRPDGDTSAPGDGPAGVVSCGVHPSFKLGVSVGIGERTMRLWDLVKGKRAGVLAFERNVLKELGEWGSLRDGEGRQVEWDEKGKKFVVSFEKGVAVFDVACKIIGVAKIGVREKVGCAKWMTNDVLAVATERGRVLFCSTRVQKASEIEDIDKTQPSAVATLQVIAQLVEAPAKSGTMSRIKDVQLLHASDTSVSGFYLITGSSDGAVRTYHILTDDFEATGKKHAGKDQAPRSIGELLATNETGHRITCLSAFVMDTQAPADTASNGYMTNGSPASAVNQEEQQKPSESSESDGDPFGSEDESPNENIQDGVDGEHEEEFGGFDDE